MNHINKIILLYIFISSFLIHNSSLFAQDYTALETFYKDLHQNPELSFYEKNTSKKMALALKDLGFEVTENIGGYGVVGVLKNGKGPTVLVRADMDALPIEENTNLPYASKIKTKDEAGNEVAVMHACGHDMHMTVWYGAAMALAQQKKNWKGTLVFIAQPAEERSGGAKNMLKDGLFKDFPYPDYALALHVNASLPAGKVGVCSGYALANVDMMDITIYGEGGHGAYPHTTKDPIVLSAQMIMALQTIVSREISPLEPAVVTVGSIHGGTKGNVIPSEVKLELTMRSYSTEVRNQIIEAIKRKCNGVAQAAGIPENKMPKYKLRDEFTPALYNNPEMTNRVKISFENAIGKENVVEMSPVMGGEDFGRYGLTEPKVPILMYWLGAVDPEKVAKAKANNETLPSLHSAYFAPLPKPTIETGVKTMTAGILELLGK